VIKRFAKFLLFFSLFLFLGGLNSYGWRILYAEQYYKLYHLHFYQYPDDSMENIFYLEQALKADFCNPLYALARITNKVEWRRYRYLFKMHVNLKLIEQYLILGSKYDKMVAYFYNAPWKEDNLKSLKIAERVYRVALGYWKEALKWSSMAWKMRYVHLPEIQYWEDENLRIETGKLNYREIIEAHLARLNRVRKDFERMDKNTY